MDTNNYDKIMPFKPKNRRKIPTKIDTIKNCIFLYRFYGIIGFFTEISNSSYL